MAGRLVLLVVLALALLGGARDAAPVGAQDEVISVVGSVTDVPPGGTVNSSRIEVRIPAGGGPVTGDWTITFTATIGLPFVDEPCTLRTTISGPLEGEYDGRNALNGTSSATESGTVIARCDGDRSTNQSTETYSWSGRFNGEEASITVWKGDFVVMFTAQKPPTERPPADDVPDASDDIDEPPDDASDSVEPPDGTSDFVDVFFGTGDIITIMSRVDELIQCTSQEDVLVVGPYCDGYIDGILASIEYRDAFLAEFPNPKEEEEALSKHLQRAIFLAGLTGEDGLPLFPSVQAALPVIARVADQRTTYAVPGENSVTVVERFIELLAGKDAAAWEERFP
ncbi:MAG: hypothetical protein J4N95_02430 [Chloroflexi bacterium]|nr:hypothetical protein [Chloroflexota bacterium]MCI0856784.1 hypothetical protein [Chloroflexota bacterium]MCI0889970.1 hypothetical protein [Chloroflexota bacterium]